MPTTTQEPAPAGTSAPTSSLTPDSGLGVAYGKAFVAVLKAQGAVAAILSVQMMLDWLGTRHADERLHEAAQQVEAAVAKLLSEGRTLTYDLIGEVKAARCSEVGAAVEERLRIA